MPAEAEPVPVAAPPDERALDLVPLLADAGATVVVEHGLVTGEILGLEVARVVTDDGGARVEVGVGRHDREAFGMLHGDLPTHAALERGRLGRPPAPAGRRAGPSVEAPRR